MYKDIISYELADGVSESHLNQVAIKVYEDWMKHQKGFVSWEINKNKDGNYTDIVVWENKESAQKSNENMAGMKHSAEWMACYKMETVKSINVESLFNY